MKLLEIFRRRASDRKNPVSGMTDEEVKKEFNSLLKDMARMLEAANDGRPWRNCDRFDDWIEAKRAWRDECSVMAATSNGHRAETQMSFEQWLFVPYRNELWQCVKDLKPKPTNAESEVKPH